MLSDVHSEFSCNSAAQACYLSTFGKAPAPNPPSGLMMDPYDNSAYYYSAASLVNNNAIMLPTQYPPPSPSMLPHQKEQMMTRYFNDLYYHAGTATTDNDSGTLYSSSFCASPMPSSTYSTSQQMMRMMMPGPGPINFHPDTPTMIMPLVRTPTLVMNNPVEGSSSSASTSEFSEEMPASLPAPPERLRFFYLSQYTECLVFPYPVRMHLIEAASCPDLEQSLQMADSLATPSECSSPAETYLICIGHREPLMMSRQMLKKIVLVLCDSVTCAIRWQATVQFPPAKRGVKKSDLQKYNQQQKRQFTAYELVQRETVELLGQLFAYHLASQRFAFKVNTTSLQRKTAFAVFQTTWHAWSHHQEENSGRLFFATASSNPHDAQLITFRDSLDKMVENVWMNRRMSDKARQAEMLNFMRVQRKKLKTLTSSSSHQNTFISMPSLFRHVAHLTVEQAQLALMRMEQAEHDPEQNPPRLPANPLLFRAGFPAVYNTNLHPNPVPFDTPALSTSLYG